MAGDLNFKVNFDTAQAGAELQSLLEKFVAGSESAGNRLNRALGGTTERKVVIRTEVDETGIKKLTSQVVTLRSEADKLKNAFATATRVDRDSITSLRGQIRQATQARDAVQQFGQAIDLTSRKQVLSAKQTEEYTALDARVKTLQQSLKNLQDADKGLSGRLADSFGELLNRGRKLQDIVTIFQSVGIAISAVTAPIKAATNALADLDQFRLSFQAIGQSSSAAAGALADASRIALGLGVNIKTVRDGFQQLSPVVLNTGGSLDDVSAITESLSSRFAAFGLGAEKSRRVLNGVIQAFGKGKLQAEELTQQISEADPAFKTDFANALFKSVDALKAAGGESAQLASELSALAKSGQRPVAALEGLVKQGKITAAVLTEILPKLSKADILFGKLGPTATTGVEAFKRGLLGLDKIPVTLRQVQANIENINQLNLEKFAKLAEPLVIVFLELQAAVTDFITRLADTSAIKDLISILSAIGTGIGNVTKFILSGIEGLVRLVGIFTPLISLLTKIPGLVELIGAALLIKFVKPVSESVASAKTLIQAFRDIGKAKSALDSTGGNQLFDPKSSQVAQKSLSELRKELQAPVSSGTTKAVKETSTALEETTKISKKSLKEATKLRATIQELGDERRAIEKEIADTQTRQATATAENASRNQSIKSIKSEISELERLRNTSKTTAQGLRNFYFQQEQAQRSAAGIGPREAFVPQIPDSANLIKQIHETDAETNNLTKRIEVLQTELNKLNAIKASPEVNIVGDLDGQIKTLKARRVELEKEIRDSAKKLSRIEVGPAQETVNIAAPTSNIESADKLIKDYKNNAVRSYIEMKMGSEDYVRQVTSEIEALDRRAKLLKGSRGNLPSLNVALPGSFDVTDELRSVQSQADKLRSSLAQLDASWARSYKGVLDYEDALTTLDSGAKLTEQQLSRLGAAGDIVQQAAVAAAAEVAGLTDEQTRLQGVASNLKTELSKLSLSDNVKADELRGQLTDVNGQLGDLDKKLQGSASAANLLAQESQLIGSALEQAAKPRPKLDGITQSLKQMSGSSNTFASNFGKLGLGVINTGTRLANLFKGIGASIASLGPQLAVFAAISIAVSAFNKQSELVKNVQQQNKAELDKLNATVNDLKDSYGALTSTAQQTNIDTLIPKFSGLEVVLISLGGAIKTVIDFLGGLFNKLSSVAQVDALTGQVTKAGDAFGAFFGVLGTTAAGALTGFLVSGLNPLGAAVGAVTGLVVGLIGVMNQSGVTVDQIKQKNEELRKGYQQQFGALRELVTQIDIYGKAYDKVKAKNDAGKGNEQSLNNQIQLFSRITAAYGALVNKSRELKLAQDSTVRSYDAASTSLVTLDQKIKSLQGELTKLNSIRSNPYRAKEIEQQIAGLTQQKAATAALRQELAKTSNTLKAQYAIIQAEIERLRKKFGLLSQEQLKNATSVDNLDAKYKELKSALELLDFGTQKQKFNEVATEMGKVKAQIDQIENAAKSRELAGYISEVKNQLANGEIPTSLATIQNLVKSLEERSISLDINSPELPKVLQDLLKAEDFTNRLDGKKAEITLELIERGLQSGSLANTLALREKQLQELGKVKQTTPIGSNEYEAILAKEKQLTQAKENDEKTVDELRSELAQKQIDRIDNIVEAQKNASEKRIQQIDRESKAIEKQYDAQIKALEGQRGPAEQELAKLQRADLEAKAKQPGRSGLEARAELERLAREEKVTQLKEEKEKKVQELADQRAAIEETITQNEYQLLDTRISAEKEIAKIRGTQIDQEISGLQQSIRNRASGQTGTTGTTTAVPGGTQQSVDQAKAAGEQAGKAYSTGYQMSIKAAGPPENDPNAKVKYNFQDPAVIAASKERNTLQEQYNALLASTKALEQQQARTTPGQQDSSVTDQILSNYQQLAALQAQMASAEQNYSNSLQATKQVTGQIVITNQTLAQQFGQLSNTKPATPVDLSKLSEAYQKVTQLNAEYKKQQGIVNALKAQTSSSDPAVRQAAIQQLAIENTKLQDLQTKLNGVKSAYSSLESTATGQGLSNSITPDNLDQLKTEIKNWASGLDTVDQSGKSVSSTLQSTSDVILQIAAASKLTEDSFKNAAGSVGSEMLPAIQQIEPELNNIQQQLDDIFNKTYEVAVVLKTEKQGLWTGGPATGGTVYKVNELGQEGFMNKFGRVTPIRKARNSSWRAPGDGFVIPADIYSQMSQTSPAAPSVGISPATPKAPSTGNDSLRSLAKFTAMLAAKAMQPSGDNGTYELSKVQAHQAQEIGKLSRAVQELNEKDWNVNVKVRNDNSLAYLKALNHRL
jgi:tape measure domain-containing protein